MIKLLRMTPSCSYNAFMWASLVPSRFNGLPLLANLLKFTFYCVQPVGEGKWWKSFNFPPLLHNSSSSREERFISSGGAWHIITTFLLVHIWPISQKWISSSSLPCFIHHEFFCHSDLGLFGLWPTISRKQAGAGQREGYKVCAVNPLWSIQQGFLEIPHLFSICCFWRRRLMWKVKWWTVVSAWFYSSFL